MERGIEREVSVLKRDPIPSDKVVFASGNRVNILIDKPTTLDHLTHDWSVDYYPYPSEPLFVEKIF